MNRRDLLRTGLTMAGVAVLASNASARNLAQTVTNENALPNTSPASRKLGGKLEVSSISLRV